MQKRFQFTYFLILFIFLQKIEIEFWMPQSKQISHIFSSFAHLLATKPMAKWYKASGQSSGGLWLKNRAEIWPFFFQIFQNYSIFQQFLFLCLFVNQCKSGVHSYQFYYVPSTSSPILKSLVPWGHLVLGWFPLW